MSPGNDKVLNLRWQVLLMIAAMTLVLISTQGTAIPAAQKGLLDVNSATQAELEAVKGIGPVTAKKIIDNRPYKSLTELKKAGLSPKEISKLKTSLTAKAAPKPAAPAATPETKKADTSATAKKAKEAKAPQPAPGAPVDLNTADQKTLESLPGIGPALAKKIAAARPYQSVADLSRVKGMSKAKIDALKDKVTVAPAKAAAPVAKPTPEVPAAKAPPAAEKPIAAQKPAAEPKPAAAAKEKKAAPKLAPGERVNLNTASQEDLEKLPGIGPTKAKAIINGRPYQSPEDIMKVRGIKEGTYKKLKDFIIVK
jgi:competence protein ComEA